MAHLASEERAFPSGVTLELGEPYEESGTWIPYRLVLTSGRRTAVLEDPDREWGPPQRRSRLRRGRPMKEGEPPVGRCALGLAPRDELAVLIQGLGDLLAGRRQKWKFEPQEPNWSLEIALAWSYRLEPQEAGWASEVATAPEGFTVMCWIDAGNQWSDHYTWDGLGIRFFTDSVRLQEFLAALVADRGKMGSGPAA